MNILFINSTKKQCGVYQYGLRLYDILKPGFPNLEYIELENGNDYLITITKKSYCVIIYNYHAATLPWLPSVMQKQVKNIGLIHDSNNFNFDITIEICPDDSLFSIPRPIFENIDEVDEYTPSFSKVKDFIDFKDENVPIFGSFGFGFDNKGFHKIVNLINKNYDHAIIKFVIPLADFDSNAQSTTSTTYQKCLAENVKPGIKLLITHDFFSTIDVLKFLRSNTMNIFLYDDLQGRGPSSVIDYAISVKRPLGISNSFMFRHFYSDQIDFGKTPLNDVMANSVAYCDKFLNKYSHKNMILKFYSILSIALTNSQASQDLFVLAMTKYRQNGYFLEIGANDPIVHNNTYLLEHHFDWKGLMVEYDSSFETAYIKHRPNSKYVIGDARNVNYLELLKDFPKNIDYLQIDLDVDNKSTLDTLELLNNTVLSDYKFATVTFEHDKYRGDYYNTRQRSREIFASRGYKLVFPDVSVFWQGKESPFEDWYIHPDLVDFNQVMQPGLNHEQIRKVL